MLAPILALAMQVTPVPAPGSELQRQCRLYVRLLDGATLGGDDMYDAGMCFGFIGGVAQGLSSMRVFCAPKTATLNTMVRVYLAYLETHPKVLDFDRSSGAYGAFKESYPCKK